MARDIRITHSAFIAARTPTMGIEPSLAVSAGHAHNALVVSRGAEDADAGLTAQERRVRDADILEAKLKRVMAEGPGAGRGHDIQGSQAGAGSGEFHKYRAARLKERARLDAMEKEEEAREAEEAFAKRKAEREAACDAKTAKNRAKRMKKKAKKGGGVAKEASAADGAGTAVENDDVAGDDLD